MSDIHILVVDDEALSRKVVARFLGEANYLITLCEDGKAALALLQNPNSPQFQVIITDRMMFGVDALVLLDELKQMPNYVNVPVIVQTGEAEKEDMLAVMRAGAFDFLYKPLSKDVLLAVVKRALNKIDKT